MPPLSQRMAVYIRKDSRAFDTMRQVTIQPGFAPSAAGSVLVSFGKTQVICAASYERRVPPWMLQQGISGGWLTAEYTMLPYSTQQRKPRDSAKGKPDGRSIEIQRLIGRSLRAVADLERMPQCTITIDCDVLQADGGTRTAAITGSYVAAMLAVRRMIADGIIKENPFREAVAAVSVGMVDESVMLDLCYIEDSNAVVDANVVMTASGKFVEFNCSGEKGVFCRSDMDEMANLAAKGIGELFRIQNAALA
jgi:ribonuclease PH